MQKEFIDYSLSPDNFATIPFDKYENDFTFIVDGKKYETNRFFADILSPIIRKYHFQDSSIDEFTINTNIKLSKQDKNIDYFQDFLQLIKFNSLKVDLAHQKLYSEYFLQLGNIDEYLRINPDYFEELSIQNVANRLKQTIEINDKRSKSDQLDIKKIIRYAAQHFEEIPRDSLMILSEDLIELIISSESLKLNEEDDLLRFILELCKNNKNYSSLFEYVNFNNVTELVFENFINNFDAEYMNGSIWRSICQRLLPSKSRINDHGRYQEKVLEIDHKKGQNFNGIMNYLNDKTHGNIHDNGTIEITSNSICNNECLPRNIVDYQAENYYYSNNDKDAFVCFDFKDKKVQLNCYSIKSYNDFPNGSHLRNWVVEVSDDKENWQIVDEHSDDSSLNNSNVIAVFETKKLDGFYRFIRIRQTGKNWQNDYEMIFYYLEFFGKLKI